MSEIILTDSNFDEEVLNSDIPVLVDFWAVWCGPCRMIAPIVEKIQEENEGKIKVGKVNVDEEQRLAVKYKVSAIPTLMVFKNGRPAKKAVGYISKEEVEALLG